MTADQATATVTRTWTGTVRLRNANDLHRGPWKDQHEC